MTSSSGRRIVLTPPSPPAAPHLGTAYTWVLADALHRAAVHLGGKSLQPQSWNMSSRRIEARFGSDPAGFEGYCRTSVAQATASQHGLGVETSSDVALRDDDPDVREQIRGHLLHLAETGAVREIEADELWCRSCEITLPPGSSQDECYACHGALSSRRSKDWFLVIDLGEVLDRAERITWTPTYALNRLRNLTDVHPLVRVNHRKRQLGVPSPLDGRSVIDPRLVGAMWPGVLRRLGHTDPVTVVAGFDIQRKWLLTMLAANPTDALPNAVVNHGTLLDEHGTKMSRYAGASLADLPEGVDPPVMRAALLSVPLGKDVRLGTLPFAGASRMHQKFVNCLRFLAGYEHDAHGIDLGAELARPFKTVEMSLAASEMSVAMAAYRKLLVHELSGVLIPRVRKQGATSLDQTRARLTSLHRVFFGDPIPPRI